MTDLPDDNTFLDIATDAMNEIGVTCPAQLIGNVDAGALKIVACAKAAGKDITRAGEFGWCALERLWLFNSVQGQSEYALPSDYSRLMIDTVWDRSQLTPMQGPLSPALWQTIKSGLIGNGIYFSRYRVVRSVNLPVKTFVVDPPSPNNGSPLVFEYQSKNFAALSDYSGTAPYFQNDSDIFLLDRDLLCKGIQWRWKRSEGLEFTTWLEDYNQTLDTLNARDRPAPGFSLTGPNYRQNFLGWGNIPDTGYGSV